MEEYITVKSYDDKLVRIPKDKKNEYLNNQRKIKLFLSKGMNIEEILRKMENDND